MWLAYLSQDTCSRYLEHFTPWVDYTCNPKCHTVHSMMFQYLFAWQVVMKCNCFFQIAQHGTSLTSVAPVCCINNQSWVLHLHMQYSNSQALDYRRQDVNKHKKKCVVCVCGACNFIMKHTYSAYIKLLFIILLCYYYW